MPRYVSVVLPLPVEKGFTYAVPADVGNQPLLGCRVLVPFGRKKLTGVVVAEDPEIDGSFKIRPLADVLDDEPSLTPELLRLTKWIAGYYVCGWGEAARAALPPGTDVRTRTIVHRLNLPDDAPEPYRDVVAVLRDHDEMSLVALRQRVTDLPLERLRRMEAEGWIRLRTELPDARIAPRMEQHLRFAPPYRDPDDVADVVDSLRGEKQQAVLGVLLDELRRGNRELLRADVTARADAPASTIQSLVRYGILEIVDRQVFRSPLESIATERPPEIALHPAQTEAIGRIVSAIESRRSHTFLLHGVTGSGKTEVYVEALKRVRADGRTGIVLVPEIALTPQTVRRFRSHFEDDVAVLHSRMSLGERFDSWRRIRSGEFGIVIGPRSAVLAPLENVGLIVVDEEHEGSYKQFDPDPRYHARDVAVMRAAMNDAVCVLGSATPALESFMNARGGKYELLSMPDRVPRKEGPAAPLPDVRVVDLTLERKKKRLEGAISHDLKEAIKVRLDAGEQVILLQNRRGYSPVVECEACGWSPECVDCAVTLTYHKHRRQLRCHYCGRAWRLPDACRSCGEDALRELGAGTQRVEEELASLFPQARIRRMDLDTTSHKGAHHEILDAFGRREIDILLGTQMIAKGLDFPNVTLVGVVNADAGLLLPEFRAEERTFQLLMQVAGRSGRAEQPGEVILQTRNPEHPVIRNALSHDYLSFAEMAIDERRQLRYPPFVRMAAVEFRGPDEAVVVDAARRWTGLLREAAPTIEVLGPEAAFISRVKKQYRYHTIVKSPRRSDARSLQNVLMDVHSRFGSAPKNVHISIDIDPVAIL